MILTNQSKVFWKWKNWNFLKKKFQWKFLTSLSKKKRKNFCQKKLVQNFQPNQIFLLFEIVEKISLLKERITQSKNIISLAWKTFFQQLKTTVLERTHISTFSFDRLCETSPSFKWFTSIVHRSIKFLKNKSYSYF